MARSQVKTFRPFLVGRYERGSDAYLDNLWPHERTAKRKWSYRHQTRTVQSAAGDYLKTLEPFKEETSANAVVDIVLESREHGVSLPAGYGDVFRRKFFAPRVAWSYNASLVRHFKGGWQQAIQPGEHSGCFVKYDLRSAYLWAGSFGLPDPDTYRFTRTLASGEGVYRVRLREPVEGTPYPFYCHHEVLATPHEIQLYDLPVEEVVCGVSWTRELPNVAERITQAVQSTTFWKKAARSYWGSWAQVAPVECWTPKSEWDLPPLATNIPWAHLIVSRVKERLFHQMDASVVHVYLDSIITRQPRRVDRSLGGWKLEEIYPDGVNIAGTGWYGHKGKPLDKMAGLPQRLRVA